MKDNFVMKLSSREMGIGNCGGRERERNKLEATRIEKGLLKGMRRCYQKRGEEILDFRESVLHGTVTIPV